MPLIASILYPVDFSPSLIAMAAAAFLGARVSLVHVVDPIGTLIDNCPICRLFVQVESIPLKITEHRGVYVYLCRLFLQTKQAKIGDPPRPALLNEEDLRGGF
jgi:hypothetical protein